MLICLTISILNAIKHVVDDSVFQHASVRNTVQLLQCETLKFLSVEL